MKRLILSASFLLMALKFFANPIALPSFKISELYFEDSGKWILEFEYTGVNQQIFPIDSICLFSSVSTEKLPKINFKGTTGVYILSKDSLASDFNILRFGDSITVKSYISSGWNYISMDVLVFGDYNGAVVGYPRAGQSICKYWYFFMKNSSPSIGFQNDIDTSGIYGTLEGIVYGKNSLPLSGKELIINFQFDERFMISESGNYAIKIFAKPTTIDRVVNQLSELKFQTIPIQPISLVMEPDSVVHRDIYLLDTLQTGIQTITENNPLIRIYPNPVKSNSNLNYEIDLPVKSADCRLELYNVGGVLLLSEQIAEPIGQVELPVAKGVIVACFRMDNKIISTTRIIVAGE